VPVRWQAVEAIPATPTGKHLFTLSEIPLGLGLAPVGAAAAPAAAAAASPAPATSAPSPAPASPTRAGSPFRTSTSSSDRRAHPRPAPAVAGAAPPGAPPARAARPRIHLIADVPGWIFERHCKRLAAHLSDEFELDIGYSDQPVDESAYDLIYPLEWRPHEQGRHRNPK